MAEAEGDPFDLISRGNDVSEAGDAWAASYLYNRASSLLANLATATRKDAGGLRKDCSTSTSSCDDGDGGLGDFRAWIRRAVELERIANLYETESGEYYTKSQQELVRALQLEVDTSSGRPSESRHSMSAEELARRRTIFELAFGTVADDGIFSSSFMTTNKSVTSGSTCRPMLDFEAKPTDTDAKDVPPTSSLSARSSVDEFPISKMEEKKDDAPGTDQSLDIPAAPVLSLSTIRNDDEDGDKEVSDIEARLASFESTIPSALKSDEERVRDLNAGLKGLGCHLPTSPDIKRHFDIHTHTPTDDEQVHQIVEMAKNEARLQGMRVDEVAVKAALGSVGNTDGDTNGGGGGVGGDDYDTLVINDEDDLAAVLQKAHLNVGGNGVNKSSIAEIFADLSKVKQDAGALDSLSQTGRILHLIASAQEHLFEASAYLEAQEDDATVADDNDAHDDDGVVIPGKFRPLMTTGMTQGRASITHAKKCVENILKSWPKK